MIGAGSLIISHSNGWSCAKEAVMDMEFDIKPDKTAKKTMVIAIKGLFDCVGKASGNVKGIFKFDAGNKVAFNAVMHGKVKLSITSELNNDFETILKEIKKWQEYYKVS
jgi:hypothetical protein